MFVLVCSKKVSEQKRTWAQLETVQRQIELINGLLELVQVLLLLWSPLSLLSLACWGTWHVIKRMKVEFSSLCRNALHLLFPVPVLVGTLYHVNICSPSDMLRKKVCLPADE